MFERINKLKAKLKNEGADGMVIATSGAMHYLLEDSKYKWQRTSRSGGPEKADPNSDVHLHKYPNMLLYIPTDGEPTLYVTYAEAKNVEHIKIRKVICFFEEFEKRLNMDISGNFIAYGESCGAAIAEMLTSINKGVKLLFAEELIDEMRMIKDEKEIEIMRRAASFTDDALKFVIPHIVPGTTARQIEHLLIQYGVERGVQDLAFSPTAHTVHPSMASAGDINAVSTTEPIVEGTAISFDFGYVIDGYCSDFGRSFCCGKAPDEMKRAYVALQYAQTEMLKMIKPGVPMGPTFDFLNERLQEHGFGKNMRKYGDGGHIGHQIGIEVHERPWLFYECNTDFTKGMIMCIEPKVWLPDLAYLRVEDMILITEDGCESLTKFDRELFELF